MKEQRVYVRHLYSFSSAVSAWSDEYEVYTQPRKDYVRARLCHALEEVWWRSRLEKLQDRLWDVVHSYRDDPDDIPLPPGIRHDLKCYDLDVKNQTVLGRVSVPKENL